MPESRAITLNAESVIYRLIRSNRRTIGFEVSAAGLTVRAPHGVGERGVERALQNRAGWITRKLAQWAERPASRQPRFVSGERFPYLGQSLTLEVADRERGARTRLSRSSDAIRIELDPHLPDEMRPPTIQRALERWYRREAEGVYAPLLANYAAALGQPRPRLIVRSQKRRWGSCAADGTIRMNWRLIGAPHDLIDYVCAHEAAHWIERNHSPAFWAVVERIMPDYRLRQARLREMEGAIAPF